ncbi:hypothetical protein GGC47_001054 [Bosea sp. OAE752]|uniref:hypothetical protein n=1 Tax=Bosea sp. OAE752 TaxID=2663873 RepID=UPI003D236479
MAAQDESLRLVAEVVDKFSTPLKNLRAMLQGINSPPGVEKMRQGFEGTQKAAGALGREVNNTLTPALNAVGIAGLSISGALLGVGAALRSFASSTSSLSLLGRETGMTVNAMRTLEEVGKRFDIAPDNMRQSFRTFTENAQELRKGVGEITGFLQSQSPAVARWAADLQRDLRNGLNPDEAYRRALEFMRRIKDPIDRGRFAEKLFGGKQFGILGSEDLAPIIKDVEAKLGQVPKSAEEGAMRFKRAMDDIQSSLIGLRDTIGTELMTTLADLTKQFSQFIDNPAVKEGFRDAVKEIAKTLKGIEWGEIGRAIVAVMGAIGTAVVEAARGINHLSDALKAFRDGRYLDVLRALDGKPIDPFAELPKLERKRDVLQQTLDHLDKVPRDRSGARGMTDREYETKRDDLVKELQGLTKEIEQLRKQQQDATIQKQSLEGSNPLGGGSLIQNAAFGAMVASGYSARGLASPWGGGGRFPALRSPSPGMRATRDALTGEGIEDAPLNADGSIPGLTREQTLRYASILGHRESGNRYNIRNGYGFSGRWQMGAAALADTGYVRPGTRNSGLTSDDTWTGKDGINSLRQFLANEGGVQDRQFLAYTARNRRALERLGVIKPGMSEAEIAGWLAAAHLKGPGGAAALARGRDNADANGTTASSYFRMMARIGAGKRGSDGMSAGGEAFNARMQALRRADLDGLDLPRVGNGTDLLRQALRSPLLSGPSVDLRGGASLDINLRGFPPGTSTNSSSEGILKEMNVRRQNAIPRAGVDI